MQYRSHFRVQSLFESHRSPVVRLNLSKDKYLLPNESEEQQTMLEKNLGILEKAARHNRVERRCDNNVCSTQLCYIDILIVLGVRDLKLLGCQVGRLQKLRKLLDLKILDFRTGVVICTQKKRCF